MTWAPHEVSDRLQQTLESLRAFSSRTRASIDSVTHILDRVLLLQDADAAPPVEEEELSAVLVRVQSALDRGAVAEVKRRDGRLALRAFDRLSTEQARRLAAHFGERPLVQAFFERRLEPQLETRWVRLIADLPPTVPLLDGVHLPRPALLETNGFVAAQRVAQTLPANLRLRDALLRLCQPGLLNLKWPFTRLTLAYVAQFSRLPPGDVWKDIADDALVEAMLLPDLRRERISRFRRSESVPPVHACMEAPAVAALRLIDDQLNGGDAGGAWTAPYFESADFRDPREFNNARSSPDTNGWRMVRDLDRKRYERFIDSLLAEDIEFFFEHSNFIEGRKEFWKGYLGQISATRCYLNAHDHALLTGRFSAAEERVRAIVRRAQRLGGSSSVNALCLFFPTVVVVEFSDTGNATYFYSHSDFTRILSTNPSSIRALKRPEFADQRRSHIGNWELKFVEQLRAYGVWR